MVYSYFHEDDYCQVEVLPAAAEAFCRKQAQAIAEFSDRHWDGTAFTDIFIRGEPPLGLSVYSISEADLLKAVPSSLQIVRTVTTGYASFVTPATGTIGIATSASCVAYADFTKGGVVAHFWLSLAGPASADECSAMEALLGDLGRAWPLLLVDWAWERVVPLQDAQGVRDYISERYGKHP